jgi:hypothetical protein
VLLELGQHLVGGGRQRREPHCAHTNTHITAEIPG